MERKNKLVDAMCYTKNCTSETMFFLGFFFGKKEENSVANDNSSSWSRERNWLKILVLLGERHVYELPLN